MSRDRVTALCVAAVVLALGTWVAFNTYWTHVTVTSKLKGEAATNPFYSVERLMHALGMRTRKIDSLRLPSAAKTVLLVDNLQIDVARTGLDSVKRWVESGGRLAVTSNVVWSTPDFQTWSGIAPSYHVVEPPAKAAADTPVRPSIHPPTPTLAPTIVNTDDEHCTSLTERKNGAPTDETLQLCGHLSEFGFVSKRTPSWALSSDGGMQLLRVTLGHGSVIVVGPGFLLEPRAFLRGDHAQAFIESTEIKQGDQLLIYSPSQAEPLLAMIWRLAAPAVVCFALAALLSIVRYIPRFGSPVPVPAAARRSLAEQLRANARFAWRTGKLAPLRAAVLRALDRDARRHVPGYESRNTRQRAEELARRTHIDAAELTSAMTDDAAGSPSVQRAAVALLEQARRALFNSHTAQGTPHDI